MIQFPKVGDTLLILSSIIVPDVHIYCLSWALQQVFVTPEGSPLKVARPFPLLAGEWYQISKFWRPTIGVKTQAESELFVTFKLDMRLKARSWVKDKIRQNDTRKMTVYKSYINVRIEDLSGNARILQPHELDNNGTPTNSIHSDNYTGREENRFYNLEL